MEQKRRFWYSFQIRLMLCCCLNRGEVRIDIYIRTDPAGNIKPDKEKSTERIDGAVATIMALDRAIRNQGTGASVYDDRGILFLWLKISPPILHIPVDMVA